MCVWRPGGLFGTGFPCVYFHARVRERLLLCIKGCREEDWGGDGREYCWVLKLRRRYDPELPNEV